MSLISCKTIKSESVDFLWRQWSQLGVAGDVPFRDRWIIDPEALLLATFVLGRQDPRLFDEVMDWCVKNERWRAFLELSSSPPHWVNWSSVVPALLESTVVLAESESDECSPYLTASRMLSLHRKWGEALFDSGLPHPFAASVTLEDAPVVVYERIHRFLMMLTSKEGKPGK